MPDAKLSLDDLDARILELNPEDRMFIVFWLARCGPDHEDGQALLRALEVVSGRKVRLGSVTGA